VPAVSGFTYVGSELELFARATNWKRYVAARIGSYLGDEVLEVGAGFGSTTRFLCTQPHRRWLCLEPDMQLAASLQATRDAGQLPDCCQAKAGSLSDLDSGDLFDSILYMDVLEHIRDDGVELAAATGHLRSGGRLIVLAPAHQWLFTPFDQAIGHFRRYNRRMLNDIARPPLQRIRIKYLDAAGMFASMGNRFVLGSGMPSGRQLWIWDKLLVPLSRIVDPLTGYAIGKSILGVWQKA